jgi:RNA polymerase sigma-70 factor (ECF subfamily)
VVSLQPSVESSGRTQHLATLMTRIAGGDEDALTDLYDTTNRLVYGLVLRILSDSGAAEEVLLDVYKQVWRRASSYDEGRGNPLAWLTTIARSRAIDRLRSGWYEQQRTESLDAARIKLTSQSGLEDAIVSSDKRKIIKTALESLPPEQREVIELAYYGGLSQSEIAASISKPLGTVKTRTRLAMIKLRELLAPIFEEAR